MSTLAQERILKTRQLVLEYLATHQISDKLNRAVNDLCRSRPRDPWLFLSDAVSDHQKEAALIDRIVARNSISNDGTPSLQLNVYGRIAQNRPPKLIATENMLLKPEHTTNAENTDDSKNDTKNEWNGITEIQSMITEHISPNLRDFKMNEQATIDSELSKLYNEKLEKINSKELSKFNLLLSISLLCANTAAKSLKKAMYQYLYQLYLNSISNENKDKLDNQLNLPNLMCVLTQSDNLPSIAVIPSNTIDPAQRVSMIFKINEMMRNELNGTNDGKKKENGNNIEINDHNGAIILNQFKKFDDLFKFVKDCVDKCNFNIDNSNVTPLVTFGVICGNDNEFIKYDSESNKYTVFGEKKPMDNSDLVSYYQKLIESCKDIEYLEDAMDSSDTEGYALLQSEMSDKVSIVGNKLYSGSIDRIESGRQQKWTQTVMVSCCDMKTITDTFTIVKGCSDASQVLIMDDTFDDNTSNPFSIDLAVACQCSIIKVALPNMKQSNQKYNRWLLLSDELNSMPNSIKDENNKTDAVDSTPVDEAHEALP